MFECERLSVINAIFELQFTNNKRENYFELLQRSGTWPFVEFLNSSKGIADFHGVYGCRDNDLQRNIW